MMSMIVRHPFGNFFSSPFDVDWSEAYKQAMIPEDGSIITRTETVRKQYRVVHKESGTIELVPFTEEVVDGSD